MPVRESSRAIGNTVATFQGYPSLPSDSESEVEMEEPSHPAIDGMAEKRQQFQMLQAQLTETKKEILVFKYPSRDRVNGTV